MQNTTVVVINAGTSETSSTAMLLSQIAKSVQGAEENVTCAFINVRDVAQDAMTALVSGRKSPALQEIEATLLDADALIVGTPVFKAGASAVFMAFFQALDNDLLIGTPVLLAGTAGSQRHALVVDDQIRGLFAYLRTYTTPTSVFAAPDDFNDPKLRTRCARAAGELLALIRADVRGIARNNTWGHYQHSYGSARETELSIDLDSDLMRLATGNGYSGQ
ncbi:NAD(P)H-dependent oxidoreductase [Brevibacterium paucivorans]